MFSVGHVSFGQNELFILREGRPFKVGQLIFSPWSDICVFETCLELYVGEFETLICVHERWTLNVRANFGGSHRGQISACIANFFCPFFSFCACSRALLFIKSVMEFAQKTFHQDFFFTKEPKNYRNFSSFCCEDLPHDGVKWPPRRTNSSTNRIELYNAPCIRCDIFWSSLLTQGINLLEPSWHNIHILLT